MHDARPQSGPVLPPLRGPSPRRPDAFGPTRARHNLAWAGVALAAAFWGVETLLDSWIFHSGTLTQSLLPHDPNEAWLRTLAACLIMAFGLYAHIVSVRLHRAQDHEKTLERELKNALAHLLADYIPMCAQCKSIRDKEQWVRIEEYVTQHTGSHFSHGLCPKCLAATEAELERS